ncbi:hypothetical protein M3Y94_01016200 [Aphelenchoides besseyi]|nr:hypothetical protein M3Y94_01016200 [Aphelenchoides besseyi]
MSFGFVSADGCFQLDKDGNGTLLIPECTGGSEVLVVQKKELLVEFKNNGLNQSKAQNITFKFGGCAVQAELDFNLNAAFTIANESRELPLKIVVHSGTDVMKENENDTHISCQPRFEKIGEPTTYTIRVTYQAENPANLKGLLVLYRGTIDTPEAPGNNLWQWVGITGGTFLVVMIVFGAVLLVNAKYGKFL